MKEKAEQKMTRTLTLNTEVTPVWYGRKAGRSGQLPWRSDWQGALNVETAETFCNLVLERNLTNTRCTFYLVVHFCFIKWTFKKKT